MNSGQLVADVSYAARESESPPWRNWAGNVVANPVATIVAACEEDIVSAVDSARRRALRIKAVGSGHSYNPIADATGAIHLSLAASRGIESIDRETNHVTVWAGMRLDDFCRALEEAGLALPVLGAIQDQTIAGLISTATHGTGLRVHSLSDAVTAMRLVDGSGCVVELSTERDPALLNAARVGLGSLGVLSSVTFACVQSFDLALVTEPITLSEAVRRLPELHKAHYFGFWWFPQTRWAVLRRAWREPRSARTTPPSTKGKRAALRDTLREAALWFAGHRSRATPWLNAAERAVCFGHRRLRRGPWYEVFSCPTPIRQMAMEYAVPLSAITFVLDELKDVFSRHVVHAPIDVRFGAADEAWLSPSFGRQTCYIGVAVAQPFNRAISYESLFAELEAVFARHAGRPHWGKIHSLEAQTLRVRYPKWDQFIAVRNIFDRDRLFANPHLCSVLGD
ncbi:FAD-binding protein [Trinickia sp. LjRoot230]|uniref:D-arabinono-1,4-lactone oxidase n=1 Tax=Trinickia sp. LjRoot230 TaxID=3342288 RepID=UPI003ED12027